jgi:hypothetical protein
MATLIFRANRLVPIGSDMSRAKFQMMKLCMLLPLVAITACSKTVQWEEEVPLNTGETIWVKRADTYVRRSEPGNPLQMGWWPKTRSYSFSWNGQPFVYQLDSKISGGAFLIYVIESEKMIAVVDGAANCTKLGYGEFRWTEGSWQLQPNIHPALIGQPRNLMDYYSADDGAIPARVTQEFIRSSRFDLPQKGGSLSHLPASKIATNCSRSK